MNVTSPATLDRRTAYDRYLESEGVPVIEDFDLRDLSNVEVAPWKRTGALASIVRLEGAQSLDDSYVLEIPPAKQTIPQRHLYEELVYVVSGRGTTTIWNNQGARVAFEWQAGSLFAIPLNAWYQHVNVSVTDPVRCYAVTNAPLMMNLIHNQDFIFNLDYDFVDRFGSSGDYISGAGTYYTGRIWDTNFVPDVNTIELQEWKQRGAGGRNILLETADGIMCGHVSEFPVGTYKKAHRHTAGAHVVILSGEGFSLLWPEGGTMRRVDWGPVRWSCHPISGSISTSTRAPPRPGTWRCASGARSTRFSRRPSSTGRLPREARRSSMSMRIQPYGTCSRTSSSARGSGRGWRS